MCCKHSKPDAKREMRIDNAFRPPTCSLMVAIVNSVALNASLIARSSELP